MLVNQLGYQILPGASPIGGSQIGGIELQLMAAKGGAYLDRSLSQCRTPTPNAESYSDVHSPWQCRFVFAAGNFPCHESCMSTRELLLSVIVNPCRELVEGVSDVGNGASRQGPERSQPSPCLTAYGICVAPQLVC